MPLAAVLQVESRALPEVVWVIRPLAPTGERHAPRWLQSYRPVSLSVRQFVVEQPAGERTAEDDDADTDQPGLDDEHGSEGAVRDGAGGDQRGEDEPGEDPQSEQGDRGGDRAGKEGGPADPAAEQEPLGDHQKNTVPMATATNPRAGESRHSGAMADRYRAPTRAPSHSTCRHRAHQRAGGRSQIPGHPAAAGGEVTSMAAPDAAPTIGLRCPRNPSSGTPGRLDAPRDLP